MSAQFCPLCNHKWDRHEGDDGWRCYHDANGEFDCMCSPALNPWQYCADGHPIIGANEIFVAERRTPQCRRCHETRDGACPNGHPMTPDNVLIIKKRGRKTDERRCRTCNKISQNLYLARKEACQQPTI